jgi:hypothetical protein
MGACKYAGISIPYTFTADTPPLVVGCGEASIPRSSGNHRDRCPLQVVCEGYSPARAVYSLYGKQVLVFYTKLCIGCAKVAQNACILARSPLHSNSSSSNNPRKHRSDRHIVLSSRLWEAFEVYSLSEESCPGGSSEVKAASNTVRTSVQPRVYLSCDMRSW